MRSHKIKMYENTIWVSTLLSDFFSCTICHSSKILYEMLLNYIDTQMTYLLWIRKMQEKMVKNENYLPKGV